MKDLLSFGEPLVGFYPPRGSSPAADVPLTKTWGGDSSNLALGAARLGLSAAYLTRVGDDPFGVGFLDLWKRNGVDTSLVQIDRSRRTGLYFVSFDGSRHSLTYYRRDSAASAISLSSIDLDLVGGFRILHLSGISLGMSVSALEVGMALARVARERGIRVSFDVNYRAPQWPGPAEASRAFEELLSEGVGFLELTDDEMEALGWGSDPESLPSRFPQARTILLKRGPRGAWIHCRGESFECPAFEVEVKDTVGAGDSFDAGFLAATLGGSGPREAARFAAAAAAITCTGTGPLEKMPWRGEVESFLAARAPLPPTAPASASPGPRRP